MWVEFMTDFMVSEKEQVLFFSWPKILKKEGSWGKIKKERKQKNKTKPAPYP